MGIQALCHGFDTARFVTSMLSELLFGNGNVDLRTMIRNDNPSVVEHVHSINPVTKERILNGFPESSMGGIGANRWLSLSRIMEHLNISDEMAKSTTRKK